MASLHSESIQIPERQIVSADGLTVTHTFDQTYLDTVEKIRLSNLEAAENVKIPTEIAPLFKSVEKMIKQMSNNFRQDETKEKKKTSPNQEDISDDEKSEFTVCKKLKEAIIPTKAYSSVGWDLTIVKQLDPKVFAKPGEFVSDMLMMFDTGLLVQCPPSMYLEIVPRSSLSKTGFILANSVGIIDPDYKGNLIIALKKIDPKAPDLELPFKGFQMLLKKVISEDLIEVDEKGTSVTTSSVTTSSVTTSSVTTPSWSETMLVPQVRGAGAFGSSDVSSTSIVLPEVDVD